MVAEMGTGAKPSSHMKVVVRLRPFNRRELEQSHRTIIKVLDESTLLFDPEEEEDEFFFRGTKQGHRDVTKRVNKKLSMNFDHTFDHDTTNVQVFEQCTKPLVMSVMDGYNCSVFVYGATGAGKTHTMLGSDSSPGVTFLTMRELFNQIDLLSGSRKFEIGISYLEVYNEQVMNLLTKSGPLRLREDSTGVVVSGLTLHPINDAEALLDLLALGNRNRTQHPTDANAESSRSHAIFQVHIRMADKKTGQKRTVKLSMIDLAGSERAASTKCMGQRFKEGASINKSLLALGNCINKLADGHKHIPYRDSNLTRILKDSLGGNCHTVMVANVSPSSATYEDTYNTLKYASRAKKIRTNAKQNMLKSNVPKEYYVQKLSSQMHENEQLRETVAKLQAELNAYKSGELTMATTNAAATAKPAPPSLKGWETRIEELYLAIKKAQETYYTLVSKQRVGKFSAKIKEHFDESKKLLFLDGTHFKTDFSTKEANSSLEKYKEDIQLWKKRFQKVKKDLDQLKDEIKSEEGLESHLAAYLKANDQEVKEQLNLIKYNHVLKINEIDHLQGQKLRRAIKYSYDINNESFLLLRANSLLDSGLKAKFEKLAKIAHGAKTIRFRTDEDNKTSENDNDFANLSCGEEEAPTNVTTVISDKSNTLKRTQDDTDINWVEPPAAVKRACIAPTVKVNPIQSCSDTQVVKCNEDNNAGSLADLTFKLSSAKKSTIIVQNLLADAKVSQSTGRTLERVLNKNNVKTNILSRVTTLAGNKENKKQFSPNRVQKVKPGLMRSGSVKMSAAAASILAARQRTKSASVASDSAKKAVVNKRAVFK